MNSNKWIKILYVRLFLSPVFLVAFYSVFCFFHNFLLGTKPPETRAVSFRAVKTLLLLYNYSKMLEMWEWMFSTYFWFVSVFCIWTNFVKYFILHVNCSYTLFVGTTELSSFVLTTFAVQSSCHVETVILTSTKRSPLG